MGGLLNAWMGGGFRVRFRVRSRVGSRSCSMMALLIVACVVIFFSMTKPDHEAK